MLENFIDFNLNIKISSKSTSRPSAATEPNKSTKHRTIPKGGVHCTVVAVHLSRLLSTICNIVDLAYLY